MKQSFKQSTTAKPEAKNITTQDHSQQSKSPAPIVELSAKHGHGKKDMILTYY